MRRSLAWAGGLVLGFGLLLTAQPAQGFITRPYPLVVLVEDSQFIFTAKVTALDPEKPSVVLTLDEDLRARADPNLKDKAPFTRLPVNLKGDSEAEKEKHTPQLLKRLAPDLPLVVFVLPKPPGWVALAYTSGTWIQLTGQKGDGDTVRWGFTHCEPYLRRTYHDSTDDLRQVVLDHLTGKKKPPDPDPKVEPGLGPEVKPAEQPKPKQGGQAPSVGRAFLPGQPGTGRNARATDPAPSYTTGPVFAVIPTVLVGGPLAILALLFPAVFGGLTLFLRRWLVVLTVVSLNSTLWVLHGWLAPALKGTWWGSPLALWVGMTLIALAGLVWAWRRQLSAIPAEEKQGGKSLPAHLPRRGDAIALGVLSLAGLAMVAGCLLSKVSLLDEGWSKPLLVMWIGIWAGTLYTLLLRRRAPEGTRTALPAEGVMLAAMVFACAGLGLTTLPLARAAAGEVQTSGDTAETEGARAVGVVWKFEPKERGTITSSPLVAGEHVYVAAAHGSAFASYGRLYCLERATGKEVWGFNDDGQMKQVFSTPFLADGRLYVGEGYHQDKICKLYCLDAATGQKVWEFSTSSHTESSPIVVGDKVYCGAGDDGLVCLNAADGKEVWSYKGVHVDCTPAVKLGKVFAGSGVGDIYRDTCLFCVDAATGKEEWRVPTDLPVWGSPVTSGKHVLYGLGNGNFVESDARPAGALVCVEAQGGRRVWECKVPDGVLNRPAVDRHRVYFGCRDGHCYCVDRQDGRVRWKQNAGSPVVAAVVLARPATASALSSVYAVGSEGRVLCLDPDDGRIDWTFDVRAESGKAPQLFSTPAVAFTHDGNVERRRLYFGAGLTGLTSASAALYCYEDAVEE
jgi:outer membrane protein assembly factor BamB